jgi:hypothetical protein
MFYDKRDNDQAVFSGARMADSNPWNGIIVLGMMQ